jgi:hypothetical protein
MIESLGQFARGTLLGFAAWSLMGAVPRLAGRA